MAVIAVTARVVLTLSVLRVGRGVARRMAVILRRRSRHQARLRWARRVQRDHEIAVADQMCRDGTVADPDLHPRMLRRVGVMADRHLVLVLGSARPKAGRGARERRAAEHPKWHEQ